MCGLTGKVSLVIGHSFRRSGPEVLTPAADDGAPLLDLCGQRQHIPRLAPGVPMLRPAFLRICVPALALVVSGCNCGERDLKRTLGELGVVWRDAAGERVINRDAVYDFGNALVGERKPLTMTVLNIGVGKLTLTTLEQTEGAE